MLVGFCRKPTPKSVLASVANMQLDSNYERAPAEIAAGFLVKKPRRLREAGRKRRTERCRRK
jgi:hypothetical protein